jgi:hypothetical protein
MMQPRNIHTQRKALSVLAAMVVAALMLVFPATTKAQASLGDLVQEGNAEWLIGTWVATDDMGQETVLSYKWQLNKHMLSIKLKTPEFQYQGVIIFLQAEEKVIQVGADNQGRTGKGNWTGEYGIARLTHTLTGDYGQAETTEFAHSQVDKNTMKIDVYEVSNSGTAVYPSSTIKLTRKK